MKQFIVTIDATNWMDEQLNEHIPTLDTNNTTRNNDFHKVTNYKLLISCPGGIIMKYIQAGGYYCCHYITVQVYQTS